VQMLQRKKTHDVFSKHSARPDGGSSAPRAALARQTRTELEDPEWSACR
jgi:hypothetical protein